MAGILSGVFTVLNPCEYTNTKNLACFQWAPVTPCLSSAPARKPAMSPIPDGEALAQALGGVGSVNQRHPGSLLTSALLGHNQQPPSPPRPPQFDPTNKDESDIPTTESSAVISCIAECGVTVRVRQEAVTGRFDSSLNDRDPLNLERKRTAVRGLDN